MAEMYYIGPANQKSIETIAEVEESGNGIEKPPVPDPDDIDVSSSALDIYQRVESFRYECSLFSPPSITVKFENDMDMERLGLFDMQSNSEFSLFKYKELEYFDNGNSEISLKKVMQDVLKASFCLSSVDSVNNKAIFVESSAYKLMREHKKKTYVNNIAPNSTTKYASSFTYVTLADILNSMTNGVVTIPPDGIKGVEDFSVLAHCFEPPRFSSFTQWSKSSTWSYVVSLISKYGYGLCYRGHGKYYAIDLVKKDFLRSFYGFIKRNFVSVGEGSSLDRVDKELGSLDIVSAVAYSRYTPSKYSTATSFMKSFKGAYNEKPNSLDYGSMVARYSGITEQSAKGYSEFKGFTGVQNVVNSIGEQSRGRPGSVYTYFEDSYISSDSRPDDKTKKYYMTAAERGLKAALNRKNMACDYNTVHWKFDSRKVDHGISKIADTVTYMANKGNFQKDLYDREQNADILKEKPKPNLPTLEAMMYVMMYFAQDSYLNSVFGELVKGATNQGISDVNYTLIPTSLNRESAGKKPTKYSVKLNANDPEPYDGDKADAYNSIQKGCSNIRIIGAFSCPTFKQSSSSSDEYTLRHNYMQVTLMTGYLGKDVKTFKCWKDFFIPYKIWDGNRIIYERIKTKKKDKIDEGKSEIKTSYATDSKLSDDLQKKLDEFSAKMKSYNIETYSVFGTLVVTATGLTSKIPEVTYDMTFYKSINQFIYPDSGVEKMLKNLNLTPEQQAQLDAIVADYRERFVYYNSETGKFESAYYAVDYSYPLHFDEDGDVIKDASYFQRARMFNESAEHRKNTSNKVQSNEQKYGEYGKRMDEMKYENSKLYRNPHLIFNSRKEED